MKKLLALFLCFVLCLSFVACGETKTDEETKKDDTTVADTKTDDTTEADTTEADTTESDTTGDDSAPVDIETDENGMPVEPVSLEAFVALMSAQVSEMNELLGAAGMQISIEARDNSLVYIYKLDSTVLGEEMPTKEDLDKEIDAQAETFTSSLEEMKAVVPDAESLILEYTDENGQVITSREFK